MTKIELLKNHPEVMHKIAEMRISYFRGFPYLYDGTIEQEKPHLEKYLRSQNANVLLALYNETVIGFCSAIPLKDEIDEIKLPFSSAGFVLNEVLYIGEIIIDEAFRGQGITRKFFESQEIFAKTNGFTKISFLTVERETTDKNCPQNYKDLEAIWRHFGYNKYTSNFIYLKWPRIDMGGKTMTNKLSIWTKII